MFEASDLRGLYAIIPTPAKPGANALDATNTVDLDETERLIESLLRDGSNGLIVLGTTGECATLSNPDYDAFVDCVCRVVRGRVPTFVGATAMGGHEVYRRLKFAQSCGADGSLLGLPMWQPLTQEMALKYYAQVSQAFPDLTIMAYANTRAFRFGFPLEFWSALVTQAPTVTSAKYSKAQGLPELIAATGGRINFMPIDMTVAEFHSISPDTTTACWATSAGMGPEPAAALIQSILGGDADRTRQLNDDIAWTNDPLKDIFNNPELFAHYNLQVEKARIAAAGYCAPGPNRPPYDVLPQSLEAAAAECGHRWRSLRERLITDGQPLATTTL